MIPESDLCADIRTKYLKIKTDMSYFYNLHFSSYNKIIRKELKLISKDRSKYSFY